MVKKVEGSILKLRKTYKQCYEVQEIRSSRMNEQGYKEYEVKWVNYDQKQNTWEPIQHLSNVTHMINKFQNSQKRKKPHYSVNVVRKPKKQEQQKTKITKYYHQSSKMSSKPQKLHQKTILNFKRNTINEFVKIQTPSIAQHSPVLKNTNIQQQDIQSSSLVSQVSNSILVKQTSIKHTSIINSNLKITQCQQDQIQQPIDSLQPLNASQKAQNGLIERNKILNYCQKKGQIQVQSQNEQQKIILSHSQKNKAKVQCRPKIVLQSVYKSKRLQALNQGNFKKLQKQQRIEGQQVPQIYYNIEETLLKMKGIQTARTEFDNKMMYCIQCENGEYKRVTKQEILRVNPKWLQVFLQQYI